MKKLFTALEEFFFPTYCLHCKKNADKLFCAFCMEFFSLADPTGRCLHCFSVDCLGCGVEKLYSAYLFDNIGAANTLYKKAKKDPFFSYWDLLLSFAVIQIERLHWKDIGAIIPYSFSERRLARRFAAFFLLPTKVNKKGPVPLYISLSEVKKKEWLLKHKGKMEKGYFLSFFSSSI